MKILVNVEKHVHVYVYTLLCNVCISLFMVQF